MRNAYAALIFLSAFLLFQVQLILAKHLLPWFGGAPSVWTTCMVFFQVLLLAGYTYAHVLGRKTDVRHQGRIHAAVLMASLLVVGALHIKWGSGLLAPSALAPVPDASPQWQLLVLLVSSCGLPFFLLASTSPLLQRWFSCRRPDASPYRLYALSNAGSLLGLLSYPLLVEPWFDLTLQAHVWALLYAVFVLGGLAVSLRLPRLPLSQQDSTSRPVLLARGTVLGWVLLAATAVAMMLAVTQQLCQEVAVIPFLWVLPLGIYLMTFIICFEGPANYRRHLIIPMVFVATFAVLVTAYQGVRLPVPYHIMFGSLFLYLFCMTCHGELVRLQPDPSRLTLFYLMIGLGGVLGGLSISVLAPMLLRGQWDFHITLMAGWLVFAFVLFLDKQSPLFRGQPVYLSMIVLMLSYIVFRLAISFLDPLKVVRLQILPLSLLTALLVAFVVHCWVCNKKWAHSPLWARLAFGLILFVVEIFFVARMKDDVAGTLYLDRNFYGTLSVSFAPDVFGVPCPNLQLKHGAILHGLQRAEAGKAHLPTSYYVVGSGVGLAVENHPRRRAGKPLRIGVLGMGVGTMAALARSGDWIRFYEINPIIIALAAGPRARFTLIGGSEAVVEVVEGDARLQLEHEREAGHPGAFDLLVMDAFTSDAVPAHLLTREAFALYAAHLRDAPSIIAVNISNRFLDLRDLVMTQAQELGFAYALISDKATDDPGGTASEWVLLSRDASFLANPAIAKRCSDYKAQREIGWTDRHSALLPLLKW